MQPFEDAPPPPMPAPPEVQSWQRLHVASPVLNSITTALRFWPFLLIAVFQEGGVVLGFLLAGGLAIALAVEVARWLRFDYRLAGTTLVVRSGVLVRRTRSVPADRVQQVSRNEKLRHRFFGVSELLVEVAGAGNEPDIRLSVVTAAEAERIRVRLQDARRELGAAPPEPDQVFFEQPNGALFRWAALASPVFIVPVMAAAAGQLGEAVDFETAREWLPAGRELWFLAAAGLIGLAAATAINLARYYDMRLLHADSDLRLDYGLLTRRKLELPTERIQALVVKKTPVNRLSRTVGLTVHNASSAGETTHSYMPAVPRLDRARLVARLLPGLDVAATLQSHPRPALRRAVFRWTWPAALVAAIGAVLSQEPAAPTLLLVTIPAAALGLRAYRVLGHGETATVVVSRLGPVREMTSFVRRSRVQSVTVAANWFQRRHGLATLQIHMAQPLGRVAIRDMDAAAATDLGNRLVRRTAEPGFLERHQGEAEEHG